MLFKMKLPSMMDHLDKAIYTIESMNLFNFIGFFPVKYQGETSYLNLMANFGGIFLLIYLIFHGRAIAKLLAICETNKKVMPLLIFLCTTYIAKLNLPLEMIFPLNIFELVLLVLINFNLISYKQIKVAIIEDISSFDPKSGLIHQL